MRNPLYTAQPRHVVVIGAGIAGISAAIQLQHAGYRVTVLEARERAGGRIKTMKKEMKGSKSSHLSIALELGASFIKGAEGNPIAHLCKSLNLHTQPVPAERCSLYDRSGLPVPKHIEEQAALRFQTMLDQAHAARHLKKRRDEELRERQEEQKMTAAAEKNSGGKSERDTKKASGGRKDALRVSTPSDGGKRSKAGRKPTPKKTDKKTKEKTEQQKKTEADEEEEEDEDEEERQEKHRKALLGELVDSFDDKTTLKEAMDKIADLREKVSLATATTTSSSRPEHDPTETQVVNWHIALLEGCVGAPLSRLSLTHWDQESTSQYKGSHCLIKEGHAALIDELVTRGKLDLRLNHVVESVDYADDTELIKLSTNKGIFEADLVVCTLPLGVLKKGAVTFVPPLPEEKRRSIDRLGCGTFNTVVLFFSTIFWDKQAFWLGRADDHQGRSYLYLSMTKVFGYPVLIAYQSGTAAEETEAKEDSEVVSEAIAFLQTVYKNSAKPLKSIVTRWMSDPFAGGSHSYVPPGATGADYDVIAAPVAARLFFAGEATNRRHPSSVAGAYESGKREAERITTLYGVVPAGDRPKVSDGQEDDVTPLDLNDLDKLTATPSTPPSNTTEPETKSEMKTEKGQERRPTTGQAKTEAASDESEQGERPDDNQSDRNSSRSMAHQETSSAEDDDAPKRTGSDRAAADADADKEAMEVEAGEAKRTPEAPSLKVERGGGEEKINNDSDQGYRSPSDEMMPLSPRFPLGGDPLLGSATAMQKRRRIAKRKRREGTKSSPEIDATTLASRPDEAREDDDGDGGAKGARQQQRQQQQQKEFEEEEQEERRRKKKREEDPNDVEEAGRHAASPAPRTARRTRRIVSDDDEQHTS